MRLEVMGEGRLLDDRGEVCLGPGIPLVLLTYLSTQSLPVHRDDLAVLFWPGKSRTLALQSLRQTLTRLRSVLPDGILVESGRSLTVAPGALASDARALEAAAGAGHAEAALAAWGGRFLEGLRSVGGWELERWHDLEQARLEARLAGAVLQGARSRQEEGTHDQALALLRQARGCLPGELELAEALFHALLAADDRTGARALLEELEVEEEMALVARLREALERRPAPQQTQVVVPEAQERARRSGAPGGRNGEGVPSGGPRPLPDGGARRARPGRHRWLAVAASFGAVLILAAGLAAGGQLAHGGTKGLPQNPAPDHLLVFCSSMATEGGDEQLYRMALDGLHKHRISRRPGCEAVWVPEPGGILLREEGTEDLYFLRPDPVNPMAEWTESRLESPVAVAGQGRAWVFARTWTEPVEGRGILLSLPDPDEGRTLLALLKPGVDRTRVLLDLPGTLEHPAWDPLHREVLFAWSGSEAELGPGASPEVEAEVGEGEGVWALPLPLGLDGRAEPKRAPYRVTSSPTRDSRPNPRGEEILLVRGWGEGVHKGDMEIRVLHRARGETVLVTSSPWNELDPVWSPDGRRLCWQSEEFGHFESQLMLGDARGGDPVHLTRGEPGRQANCIFTPDGDHMIYRGTSATGAAAIMLTSASGRVHRDLSRTRWDAHPLFFISREVVGDTLADGGGGR